MQLIVSKRSCTFVKWMFGGSSASFESTEVGLVDAKEAENDEGSADFDAIDAMVKREAWIREAGYVGA